MSTMKYFFDSKLKMKTQTFETIFCQINKKYLHQKENIIFNLYLYKFENYSTLATKMSFLCDKLNSYNSFISIKINFKYFIFILYRVITNFNFM